MIDLGLKSELLGVLLTQRLQTLHLELVKHYCYLAHFLLILLKYHIHTSKLLADF